MCGFVGVARSAARGPVARDELERLLPLLAHRGPDGGGALARGGVGLAATRLAVQGDDQGAQPLLSPSGRVALAFNGEVLASGQRALRRALKDAGAAPPAPAAGDSALLLALLTHALEHDGGLSSPLAQQALEVVARGMGALALLDLATGRALLLRDRLGVKPLATFEGRPGETWFASELEPLLHVRGAGGLDLAALASLARTQRPGLALPLTGLRHLPPGTSLLLGPDGSAERASVGAPLLPRRRPAAEAEAARRELAAALAGAAREAARVDGPASLFLSGGLDSAAAAAAAGRRDVLALTGRFEPHGGPDDESASAAAVAAWLGLAHEVVDLSTASLLDDLPDVVRALELPLAGPGSLALWRMSARARAHGRVVLTGTGGDELLGGYARTALALGRAGPWTEGYEGLAARLRALPDAAARRAAAQDRGGDLLPLLDPDFRAALARAEAPEPPGAPPGWEGELDQALWPEVHGTLPALLHVEDRVTMAHGLEGRPVFCLGALPDAALALPPEEVVGADGEGKRALRRLLVGRVPARVLDDRRKRGFPTPFAAAARGAGRARVLALFTERRFVERGWWDAAACRALLDEARPAHDRALFALLSWEHWARLYVDGDVLRRPPRAAARGAIA
jgi:asparagine synthase (glutamine-hydrolysing)